MISAREKKQGKIVREAGMGRVTTVNMADVITLKKSFGP